MTFETPKVKVGYTKDADYSGQEYQAKFKAENELFIDELKKRLAIVMGTVASRNGNTPSPILIARACGFSDQTARNYLNGSRCPDGATFTRILVAYPQINADWMMRGVGPMLNNGVTTDEDQPTDTLEVDENALKAENALLKDMVAQLKEQVQQLTEDKRFLQKMIKV